VRFLPFCQVATKYKLTMRNTFLVIKYEIITTLQKRSFWILTFVFPVFILFISVGTQIIGGRAIETAEEQASSIEYQASIASGIGFVDQSGLIQDIPIWIPEDFFIRYSDVSSAKADLQAGLLRQYYLVPSDFLETGSYFLIDREYQPMRSTNNAEIFEKVILENLIKQDELGLLLNEPTRNIQHHQIKPTSEPDEENPLTFIVPFATLFIFFFTITSSSGFMLTSVTREKESRTAEILLVSIKPRELMLGKVIGLGCVALLQMSIWMGGAIFSLNRSSEFTDLTSTFSLPSGFAFWGILFFLFGYFLYASLLGALGALAPNSREGGQFTFIIILPLLIPLWFNVAFTENPNGPVATFLSLFPLTSISMMTRITASVVPIWQIILSLGGLVLTTYFVVLIAAKFFQAETLLSSDSISLKRIFDAFKRQSGDL
jgi:ABC-2 type transport system permease protein